MPDWRRDLNPSSANDNVEWTDPYRTCCTANGWIGVVLAARIMRLKSAWKHDALFDYTDRYVPEARKRQIAGWMVSWSDFNLEMWDKYRSQF